MNIRDLVLNGVDNDLVDQLDDDAVLLGDLLGLLLDFRLIRAVQFADDVVDAAAGGD